jgi:hypothetical protein
VLATFIKYCSKEWQKEDYSEHKKVCQFYATFDKLFLRVCECCGQYENVSKKCADCGKIYYCGVPCQKKDWPIHKLECKKLLKERDDVSVLYKINLNVIHFFVGILFGTHNTENGRIKSFKVKLSNYEKLEQIKSVYDLLYIMDISINDDGNNYTILNQIRKREGFVQLEIIINNKSIIRIY